MKKAAKVKMDLELDVLTCSNGMSVDFSRKSMSLEVTIPTNLPPILPFSVMGIPQNPFLRLISSTSPT